MKLNEREVQQIKKDYFSPNMLPMNDLWTSRMLNIFETVETLFADIKKYEEEKRNIVEFLNKNIVNKNCSISDFSSDKDNLCFNVKTENNETPQLISSKNIEAYIDIPEK